MHLCVFVSVSTSYVHTYSPTFVCFAVCKWLQQEELVTAHSLSLLQDGCFLVRAAQKGDGFSLSLWYAGQPRHLRCVCLPLLELFMCYTVTWIFLLRKVCSFLYADYTCLSLLRRRAEVICLSLLLSLHTHLQLLVLIALNHF